MVATVEVGAPSRRKPSIRFVQINLAGTAIGTAMTASLVRAGTLVWSRDLNILYQRTADASKNALWSAVAGQGQLSKYWVAPAGQQPAGAFSTWASATTQAQVDGHNAANPVAIYGLPGTYVENYNTKDGIDLIGLGGEVSEDVSIFPNNGGPTTSATFFNPDVIIAGTLSFAGMTSGMTVQGIAFEASSATNLVDLGSGSLSGVTITARHCQFAQAGAGDCIGGAPTGATPVVLNLDRCQVECLSSGTMAALNFTTTVTLNVLRSSFALKGGAQSALKLAGGTHIFEDCRIFGRIAYSAAANDVYRNAWLVVSNTVEAIAFGTSAATLSWASGAITGAQHPGTFTGTGTITLAGEIISDGNGITGSGGTVSIAFASVVRVYTSANAITAGTLTAITVDTQPVDTSAASQTIVLPLSTNLPQGTKVRFVKKTADAANHITVTANAADKLQNVLGASANSGTTATSWIEVQLTANGWVVSAG